MTGDEVSARLATVSALRQLGLRLPHLATPAELSRLRRFEALVLAPEQATADDVEALVAGWSRWWREQRTAELVDMARRLATTLVDSDRRLATLVTAASEGHASPPPPRG